MEYFHSPTIIIVDVIEEGDRSTAPSIVLETVNEDFDENPAALAYGLIQ